LQPDLAHQRFGKGALLAKELFGLSEESLQRAQGPGGVESAPQLGEATIQLVEKDDESV
jgi:hypothetical protein